jgi:hypothetical protein
VCMLLREKPGIGHKLLSSSNIVTVPQITYFCVRTMARNRWAKLLSCRAAPFEVFLRRYTLMDDLCVPSRDHMQANAILSTVWILQNLAASLHVVAIFTLHMYGSCVSEPQASQSPLVRSK